MLVTEAIEKGRLIHVDGLTELHNRRAFYDLLEAEISRSQRHLRPLSLLLIGLDDLKVDSNMFENPAGDAMLKDVARWLNKSVRSCDVVARHGVDEFAIILGEADKTYAVSVADRLSRLVEESSFEHDHIFADKDHAVTISVGIASYPTDACQAMELVAKADKALYEAKTLGGNLVRTAERELAPMGAYHGKPLYFLCKRCMDIILSLLFLVIAFPLILLIALLIKLDSPGPVFFKQERVGLRRRAGGGHKRWELALFTMYKFRTMSPNIDGTFHRAFMRAFVNHQVGGSEDGKIHKPVQASQTTRIGRILRKTSLDELPQILNVLKGEMSLVGPRPNVPWEVERYQPWHYKRLEVLPGITGLAQVRGRSCILFDEIVRYDIEYIEKQSLSMDLNILWWTVLYVVFGRGAF